MRRLMFFVSLLTLIATMATAQDQGQNEIVADDPVPASALARRPIELVLSDPDRMFLFTPKTQILVVGSRCADKNQTCLFEAEFAERDALEYRWHAETKYSRVFGSDELPRFRLEFTSGSPREGYQIVLQSRRIDSPASPWQESEYTVHIDGRPWPWPYRLAVIGGGAALGALIPHMANPSHETRRTIIGSAAGGVIGALVSTISW